MLIRISTLVLAVVLVGIPHPAAACPGPSAEYHHYPSCTIPPPESHQEVTLVKARGWPAEFADHHLGNATTKTVVENVHVAENGGSIYLVLSAYSQTIWRFTGDIDSLSRIVVLGSTRVGPNGAGVIGVPPDRVTFTSPDLPLLDAVWKTSCTRIYKSCIPEQWFGDPLGDRVIFHPKPEQRRFRHSFEVHGRFVLHRGQGLIRSVTPVDPGRTVTIDPLSVVSRDPPLPYEILPGKPGLDALEASGALVPADQEPKRLEDFGEAFSQRFRTRFDPDFSFTPPVDFIVTRAIVLPPELPPTALLVAAGVPAPEMNGNGGYTVCLYFEDQAGNPARGNMFEGNRCRLHSITRAVPDDAGDVLKDAADFDRMPAASLKCSLAAFPENTYVVAITPSEGKFRRYRGDTMRRIDVSVDWQGPTVLYLSMDGGPTEWNVTGTQVLAIFGKRGSDPEMSRVVLNGKPHSHVGLRSSEEGCPQFPPTAPHRLGPAIAHLDEMLATLIGHRIDRHVAEVGRYVVLGGP